MTINDLVNAFNFRYISADKKTLESSKNIPKIRDCLIDIVQK